MKVLQVLRSRAGARLLMLQQHAPGSAAPTSALAALARRSSAAAAPNSMRIAPNAFAVRRQFASATAVRLSAAPTPVAAAAAPASPSAAKQPTAEPAAGASPSDAAAAPPADDVDNVKIDLSTIGAETTRVLTIADVLSSREQQVANRELFEEWESIPGSKSVHDAVELMVKCNMRSLIVTEEKSGIVGIITERDVLRKTSPRTILTAETLVRDIMSSHIMCVPPTTTVIDALATMTKENIRHLAVINGELSNTVKIDSVPEEAMRCVLSIKDIVKAYAEFEAEKKKQAAQAQSDAGGDAAAPAASAASAASASGAAASSSSEPAADSPPSSPSSASSSSSPSPAAVTAATLLKKKHKKIKLILNTREEDGISVADAVEAMARQNFGAVLVVDKDQRVLGIFTERDYLAKVVYFKEDPSAIRMVDVSTRRVACLQIEDSLEKCWGEAATQDFRHFPVVGVMRKGREKELAGILSIKDIVREISKEHNTTPGFRLMEFFKSKMEPKPEPKLEPVAAPPAAAAAPAASDTPAASASAQVTKAADADAASEAAQSTTTTATKA